MDGKQIQVTDYIGLPAAGGMTDSATSEIHTRGRETDPEPGVIHIESGTKDFRANLRQFFDVWGVYAASDQLGGYDQPIKAWINGEPVTDWLTSTCRSTTRSRWWWATSLPTSSLTSPSSSKTGSSRWPRNPSIPR